MAKALVPGDRAPAFRLTAEKDGEISSAALKGNPYVLYFYPKDDTSGCTKEAIDFSENARKFANLGVTVIGVSKDSVQSHEKFRTKHNLRIRLGSDQDTKTARDYAVWIEKKLYGRTYMGTDRATFLVDDRGVIRQIWRKVKVPGHADAVLEAARTMRGGKSPPA